MPTPTQTLTLADSLAGPAQADPTRFVLIEPSHPGNVGAVARAMKVMGFSDLVLVTPRYPNVQRKVEAIALASGATDVLAGARVVGTLTEALDGVTYVCATVMTQRDFGPPTHAPRALFETLAADNQRVAFLFGCERYGMSNEDVYRCHACLSIPTAHGNGSLNLAQAVQLIAYDWRQALGGFDTTRSLKSPRAADAVAVTGLLQHWEEVLVQIGYLDRASPRKLMPRLHQALNRLGVTDEEIHILRGVARAVIDSELSRDRDKQSSDRVGPPD
jgi:tRNA/rRNA methyltransferase